ncbi:MAG TPA: potassium-transporting ATPase subunit KdpC [Thermoanaerobaculia bacterium]|nr:potassium-transporting ATPase subunit KdpC [Thermoanaerobaculia bacterium]
MASEPPGSSSVSAAIKNQLRAAAFAVLLLTVLTGVVFPLVVTLLARSLFPRQAAGSLIDKDGRVTGSELIGQDFRAPGYFHPRPSAAGSGYDGLSSAGTNLGPLSPSLTAGARHDPWKPDANESYDGISQLAAAYRRENGLTRQSPLPVDAVTRSGSGLDPHISPANAALQATRVARARHLPLERVLRLIALHTEPRQWLFLGEPRVNVLALNLALDQVALLRAGRDR